MISHCYRYPWVVYQKGWVTKNKSTGRHHAPAESIRKNTGGSTPEKKRRAQEAIEYANCVCINNVYTGAGCDVIGKFCDTP